MSFLESLPLEILYDIISYINKIEDLKSICLTSKILLVITNDFNSSKKMCWIVREIIKEKNLQEVRIFHIGGCSMETTEEIDKLLAALYNNSLHQFSYLFDEQSEFSKESQTKYICLYQKRTCNLRSSYFFEAILYLPPKIRNNFLNSITKLSNSAIILPWFFEIFFTFLGNENNN